MPTPSFKTYHAKRSPKRQIDATEFPCMKKGYATHRYFTILETVLLKIGPSQVNHLKSILYIYIYI